MIGDILKVLQDLSFSEYEAKAYLALIEKSPLSGYAVSLSSGVPRSKIYEVLGSMVSRGDVMICQEPTPLYSPVPPNDLIARRKQKAEQIFHTAEETLEQFAQSAQTRDGIWNISGRETIIRQIQESIRNAKIRVLLEVWKEDAHTVEDALKQAAERGVRVLIVAYGEIDFPFAEVYQHDMSEEIESEFGGRWMVFSADDREVVAGIVSLSDESRAAWTTHPGLVMPITEIVIHDIYLMEIMNLFRPEIEEKFGKDLIDLRKKFALSPLGNKYS